MAATELARREEDWVCVAVFEFAVAAGEAEKETVELYRGPEARCLRFSELLDRAGAAGRGLRYEGSRRDAVLHALTVVGPVSSLQPELA